MMQKPKKTFSQFSVNLQKLALISFILLMFCSCQKKTETLKNIDFIPKSIISLSPAATEILFAVGAQNQIVAVSDLSDYPPEFCGGAFNIINSIYPFTNQYKTLSFPVDLFPTINSFHSEDIKIYFIFSSKNKNFQLSKDSLINFLTISSTNNCIDIKPYAINFITDEALKSNIFKALEIIPDINSEYSIIEYCCHIQNKENKGLIKIELGSEICDSNSNTLSHNLTYIFNKQ